MHIILTEIEASPGIDRILQLLAQQFLTAVYRELEKIDAGTSARKTSLIAAGIPDAERRVELLESKDGCPGCRCDILEEFASIGIREVLQDVPEHLDCGMFFVIVTNHVHSSVEGVSSEISNIDFGRTTTDQSLEF